MEPQPPTHKHSTPHQLTSIGSQSPYALLLFAIVALLKDPQSAEHWYKLRTWFMFAVGFWSAKLGCDELGDIGIVLCSELLYCCCWRLEIWLSFGEDEAAMGAAVGESWYGLSAALRVLDVEVLCFEAE
ncbi:hypothetical protein Drorol1_Dr00012026 [Drosera rotundifolia]